nr:hypothetical protein [Streptomyces sp. TRM68367]
MLGTDEFGTWLFCAEGEVHRKNVHVQVGVRAETSPEEHLALFSAPVCGAGPKYRSSGPAQTTGAPCGRPSWTSKKSVSSSTRMFSWSAILRSQW